MKRKLRKETTLAIKSDKLGSLERSRLTPKQRGFLVFLQVNWKLLAGEVNEMVKAAGVSSASYYIWNKQPLFQEAMQNLTQEMIRLHSSRLVARSIEVGMKDSFPDRKMMLETAGIVNKEEKNTNVQVNIALPGWAKD